jgi:hypothetical protein
MLLHMLVGLILSLSLHTGNAKPDTPEHPVCGELTPVLLVDRWECVHGPDPGIAIPGAATALPYALDPGECLNEEGPSYRVLYVRGQSTPSRYAIAVRDIRAHAEDASRIFLASSGGERSIRYERDAACNVIVDEVVIPDGSVGAFGSSINALISRGYNRPDRNYLMFVDARIYCGIGTVRPDSRPDPAENRNNSGGSYSRVDYGCWSGFVAAHEIVHNLGGVQNDAPNTSGGFHCVDEWDVMCYVDGPGVVMRFVCPEDEANLLDCRDDDYFAMEPRGSYLSGAWNVANSGFLVAAATPEPTPVPTATPVPPTPTPKPTVTPTPDVREKVCKKVDGKKRCRYPNVWEKMR